MSVFKANLGQHADLTAVLRYRPEVLDGVIVQNNPVNRVDPSGLDARLWFWGAHAGVTVDNPDKPGKVVTIQQGPDASYIDALVGGVNGQGVPGKVTIGSGNMPLSVTALTKQQSASADRDLIARAYESQKAYANGDMKYSWTGYGNNGNSQNCIGFAVGLMNSSGQASTAATSANSSMK